MTQNPQIKNFVIILFLQNGIKYSLRKTNHAYIYIYIYIEIELDGKN